MSTTDYQLITTAATLNRAVEEATKHAAVGFDTETTSLDPYQGHLRLVQLSMPGAPVCVIDLNCFATEGHLATCDDLAALRRLLAAPRPVKIAHNAKFDAKWIKHHLGVELGGVFDTLLASQLISAGNQEDRHGLDAVATRYLRETIDKSERLSDWSGELSDAQLRYAARDANVLLPLRERLIERLKAEDLIRCATLEFDCVKPVAELELAGFYLDQGRWREQMQNIEKKREQLADELQEMLALGTATQGSLFGPSRSEINIDSHVQLTKALKRLGVPVPDSTRNWKLQPLAAQYPSVAKLLEYRTVQKANTSYGQNLLDEINPVTNRLHANFHQIGAPTGRFSCLAGDTLVSTNAGFKRMDAIKEGDQVKTSYGFKKVQRAWMTGIRQLYKVRLRDGRTIRATEDHRFLTERGDVWKSLGELRAGDTLFVSLKTVEFVECKYPSQISIDLPEVRSTKPVILPNALSPALCELMGLVIADGFLGRRHERPVTRGRLSGTPAVYDRICLAFHWKDEQLIERVVTNSDKLFGQPFVEVKSRTCRAFQLASTKLAQFFANLGLTGDAHTKTIPDIIMSSPPTYQAAFLRGLFEGDGHRTDNTVVLTSVNHRLLLQVQLMLSNLGIYSIVKQRNDTSGFSGSTRYVLTVCKKADLAVFAQYIGFVTERKNKPFNQASQATDGLLTPFRVDGAQLFREAVAAGATTASRKGVKPFIGYYKNNFIKDESIKKLVSRFGMLPSLKTAADYLDLKLRPVAIDSITLDRVEKVYDITVDDVHEFIANGIVVHNCTNPNIQQVPHDVEYRRCFRAPAGRKLVIADYSQIELRILAEFTGDEGFIRAFNTGADLHRVTAAQVFGVAEDQVTGEQRSFAKRLNFGVVYGIGAQRFSAMTGLPLTESEEIMRRYFATYRALDAWLRDAARRALRERTSRTVSGRLARFNFDPEDRQAASLAQRNGKNSPIQGSSADILKRALTLLHDELRTGTTARLVNIVHDEIIVEAPEDEADEVARKVERAMCAAGEEYVKAVPIKVDTAVTDEWIK